MENDHQPPVPPLSHHSLPTTLFTVMLTVTTGMLIAMGIQLLAYYVYGTEPKAFIEALPSTGDQVSVRNFLRGITFSDHFLSFLMPSMVAAWLLYQKNWTRFLKINTAPLLVGLLLTFWLVIAAMPMVQLMIWWNQKIPLPSWATGMEDQMEGILRVFLTMESPWELAFTFLVMAILPAVGEEFLFRGLIQQTVERWLKSAHAAVWIAAFIFSFFHFQFEGFLARMFLGLLLGYLLVWTRNMWIPVFAHLVFNGMQVVTTYFYAEKLDELNLETAPSPSIAILIISFILVPVIGWRIRETHNKTRLISQT